MGNVFYMKIKELFVLIVLVIFLVSCARLGFRPAFPGPLTVIVKRFSPRGTKSLQL